MIYAFTAPNSSCLVPDDRLAQPFLALHDGVDGADADVVPLAIGDPALDRGDGGRHVDGADAQAEDIGEVTSMRVSASLAD